MTPQQFASLTEKAQEWFLNGEHGASSKTLFSFVTGINIQDIGTHHPVDIDDFRRCRLAAEALDASTEDLTAVADASYAWTRIINFWDDLCVVHDAEDPDWREAPGKAPETLALLKYTLTEEL